MVDNHNPSTTKDLLFYPGGFSAHDMIDGIVHQAVLKTNHEAAHGMGDWLAHHNAAHDSPISKSLFEPKSSSDVIGLLTHSAEIVELLKKGGKDLAPPKFSVVTVGGKGDGKLNAEALAGKLAPHVKGTDVDVEAAIGLLEKYSSATFGGSDVEKTIEVSKPKLKIDNPV